MKQQQQQQQVTQQQASTPTATAVQVQQPIIVQQLQQQQIQTQQLVGQKTIPISGANIVQQGQTAVVVSISQNSAITSASPVQIRNYVHRPVVSGFHSPSALSALVAMCVYSKSYYAGNDRDERQSATNAIKFYCYSANETDNYEHDDKFDLTHHTTNNTDHTDFDRHDTDVAQ